MLWLITAALRSCWNFSLSGLASSWAATNVEGMKSIIMKKLDKAITLRVSFIKPAFYECRLKLTCEVVWPL
jgi:hypothetical protein